jgi:hypothetical protein
MAMMFIIIVIIITIIKFYFLFNSTIHCCLTCCPLNNKCPPNSRPSFKYASVVFFSILFCSVLFTSFLFFLSFFFFYLLSLFFFLLLSPSLPMGAGRNVTSTRNGISIQKIVYSYLILGLPIFQSSCQVILKQFLCYSIYIYAQAMFQPNDSLFVLFLCEIYCDVFFLPVISRFGILDSHNCEC